MINAIGKDDPFYGIYEGMKDSADESRSADFRKLAEAVLEELRKSGFSPKDVESGDGHFVFYTGENSVWQFRLEETPRWIWGIWLDYDFYGDGRYRAWLFGQFEETIDKFKPEASAFEKQMFLSENGLDGLEEALEEVRFVRDNPCKAFAIDNREDAETEEEGKRIYGEWLAEKKAEEEAVAYCDEEMEKFVKDLMKDPLFDGARLHDMGPLLAFKGRYRIVLDMDNPEVKELAGEPGLIGIVDGDGNDPIAAKAGELLIYARSKGAYSWRSKYCSDVIAAEKGDDLRIYDRWIAPVSRDYAAEYLKRKAERAKAMASCLE